MGPFAACLHPSSSVAPPYSLLEAPGPRRPLLLVACSLGVQGFLRGVVLKPLAHHYHPAAMTMTGAHLHSVSIPLKIGMFGGGTVGGGVYELCEAKRELFEVLGCHADIAKICVRDASKKRDFAMKSSTLLTQDYDEILEDDSINCVVELMGGVTDAKDVVFKAIEKGKHVITANKALVAQHLPEIEALLKKHPEVLFAYEAAVCGGIPIIATLQNDYLGDNITKICGIMNGTTNFMLSKMENEGADYDDVLKEAQELGFAEADPTADVEGHDVQAKVALLAKLAFGVSVPTEAVPCQGISKLTSADFEFAKMMKSTIKLLGTAMLNADGSKLSVFVSPVLVPFTSPIASSQGPGNIVSITSANLGTSSYAGPGAGRFPTANSVVSDIVRIGRGLGVSPFPYNKPMTLEGDFEGEFYTRITCRDALGIIRNVGQLAEQNGVGIHAILQNPIVDRDNVDFVVTTEPCRLSQVQSFCRQVGQEKWAKCEPSVLSLL
ncbi:unnamed protein product [Chrysoparadoxa australica]